MDNINDILKGRDLDEFLANAKHFEIKNLHQSARSQKIAVSNSIEDAKASPNLKYSADENDAYISRLGKLHRFLSLVDFKASAVLMKHNHKEKMRNKQEYMSAEKLKAFKRILHKHCPVEIRNAIFKEYNVVKAEIRNKYFPEKEVIE